MLISTHTKNATTYNAVGFIERAVEPGEYYILFLHFHVHCTSCISSSTMIFTLCAFSTVMCVHLVVLCETSYLQLLAMVRGTGLVS